jgi:hypothetical protein
MQQVKKIHRKNRAELGLPLVCRVTGGYSTPYRGTLDALHHVINAKELATFKSQALCVLVEYL